VVGGENPRVRFGTLALVCLGLFAALFARLWYLQVLNADAYRVVATRNATRTLVIPAPRGRILDRNGNVLVDNTPTKVVAIDRQTMADVSDSDAVLSRIAALLNRYEKPKKRFTLASIKDTLAHNRVGPYDPVPLAQGVSDDLQVYLTEHRAEFPGVVAETQLLRQYHYGSLAAQVLGYVGPISDAMWQKYEHAADPYPKDAVVGRAGVEQSFEKYLRGKDGKRVVEVRPHGSIVRTEKVTPPVPGNDVYLTVNIDAQSVAEQSVAQSLAQARTIVDQHTGKYPPAPAGSAILIDPRNGQVLAMASNPTYDPEVFVPSISNADWAALNAKANFTPFLNRTVGDLYSPGSTFKLITALAGLHTGLINSTTTVDDPGVYPILGCTPAGTPACNKRNDDSEINGPTNLQAAITKSSDYYFYRIGDLFWQNSAKKQWGPTPIQDMARSLGFAKATGIELPDEQVGRIPDPAWKAAYVKANHGNPDDGRWYSGDNLNLAIGQGAVDVSPLQLADAYGQFANGGVRYQPTLLLKVTGAFEPTKVLKTSKPVVAGRITIEPSWQATLMAGFEGVITDGTAAAPFEGFPQATFPIGGKTGTAEVGADPNNPLSSNSFFVGFGPNPNARYVGVAVLEQAGYGGTYAAPVVRDLLQPLAESGHFPKVTPTIPWTTPPSPTTTTSTTTTTLVPGAGGTGPNVTLPPGSVDTTETTTPGADATGGQ
jgi:penicillin-binding protein 2